ncbi:MAG TPA: TonB-dependent receptor [Caulobacteraceae bacterium]
MRKFLLLASCLSALPSMVMAQEVDQVIVTATRLPSIAEDIPGVRVIDAAEIEDRQAIFAIDVLNTVPGLSVFRTGGAGGSTSIRLRGAETDKTLVLVDGVPVNDPSLPDGGFDLSALDLADVSRIEVLAGPQGSIWGSDAIGGVVAFTTRELDGWRARAEAGSRNTLRAAAAVGSANEDGAIGASLSGYRTDGVSAVAGGTEDDGFETWTAGVNGRRRLGPIELDGRIRYAEADVDQDGYDELFVFGDTDAHYHSQSWSGFARGRFSALGLAQTISLSAYDIDRESRSVFSTAYQADRRVWRWTAEGGAPADPLAFVVGAEREDIAATLSAGEADQGATAAFAVVRWSPTARLTANASLRYDDPDAYDAETTARMSAAFDLGAGFIASAAWGQGFKTPTISHTVCDFCFPEGPSVGLRPERAQGWDARLAWRSPDGRFAGDVTGYRLTVEDQIAYFFNPDDFTSRYVNLERTRTDGIEAQAEARLTEALRLKATYAWTDAIDAITGEELYRAPEHSGSVMVAWRRGPASGALTVRAESAQADIEPASFTRARRKGFVVADLAGAYALREGVEVTARVENLTDEAFQEVLGYGEPGRGVFVGLRVRR